MGLYKKMRTSNGVPVEYHRITRLEIETNLRVGVYVSSYLSQEERERELEGEHTFVAESYYCTETPEGPATVAEAYSWLKAERPEFEGAEDVFEDTQEEAA